MFKLKFVELCCDLIDVEGAFGLDSVVMVSLSGIIVCSVVK